MRVLVVTNLTPDAAAPGRGSFVRDQLRALEALGVEIELFSFPVGARHYAPATREVRRRLRAERFDLVHAHYGLAGWCAALAGARPLVVTFHGTDVRHPTVGRLSRRLVARAELSGVASRQLLDPDGDNPALGDRARRVAVLPCGADLDRFRPQRQLEARRRLGLDPRGRYVLFPSARARPEKRYDRAAQLAGLAGAQLLTGGGIEAARMPDWVNASNAVLVTSDYEGFGLVAVEAMACDVPVLSTPVGVAPLLLDGIDGCLAAPFDAEVWTAALRPHLDADDSRVRGRARARWFSAELMAERVLAAYRELIEKGPASGGSSAERPTDLS